jgi:hypothetical protein
MLEISASSGHRKVNDIVGVVVVAVFKQYCLKHLISIMKTLEKKMHLRGK